MHWFITFHAQFPHFGLLPLHLSLGNFNKIYIEELFGICVTEAPVDMTGDLTSVEVMEKEDAIFVCELSKPKQEVTWQIKGKKIKPNKKYEMSSDGKQYKLVIKDCQLSDAAEVSCIAKDCKSTAQLIVKGTTQTQPSCMPGFRHKKLIYSSFPVIQKVGNVGTFVFFKFKNKSDGEANILNFNLTHRDMCKLALK